MDVARALTVLPAGGDLFQRTKEYLRRRYEHGFSFVDCSSFLPMEDLRPDEHFRIAGLDRCRVEYRVPAVICSFRVPSLMSRLLLIVISWLLVASETGLAIARHGTLTLSSSSFVASGSRDSSASQEIGARGQ